MFECLHSGFSVAQVVMKLSTGLVWQSFIEVVNNGLLGAFAKLRIATIRVVMSVRPHGTPRLPLGRFLLNLAFEGF